MVFRLFLSHSSPSAAAKARLHEMKAEVEAAAPDSAVRVLYDQDQIVSGDDWRRRISFMLHACHGGVVLLDEAALASKWVLVEAAFLSLRRAADDRFVFVPVSFLEDADLGSAVRARTGERRNPTDTAWDVVDLTSVQYVHPDSVAGAAAAVVAALNARGDLQAEASPADRLADQLAPKLRDAGDAALRALADTLEDAGAYLTENARTQAALAVVRHMMRTARLTEARRLMDPLGTAFPAPQRLEIMTELSPLAVTSEAPAMLTRRRSLGGYAHASLCAEWPSFTIPLYIRRAHLARLPPGHFGVANTLGTFEELSANLRDEWRRLNPSRIRQLTDEQVDERLASLERYVWVPGPVDADVLARLDRTYPRIAFVVHYVEGAEPSVLPPGLLPITPALARTEEDAIVTDYEDAMSLLTGEH